MSLILQMKNIVKSFSGQRVLHGVSLDLEEGEVHALIGENGAGKSTLMRILMGECGVDSGEIVLRGQPVNISSPERALGLGISKIHQELSPIPEMTIAENLYLGREPNRFGIVNMKKQESMTAEQLKFLGLTLEPKTKMKELSVAETQMVETAKAISYQSRILIMDEPTSAIAETEVQRLFSMIRFLRSKGVAIIYISHKIDELFLIADRVTVLRDGARAGGGRITELSRQDLIRMMVGRKLTEVYPKEEAPVGETVLSVRKLARRDEFEDISFDLHAGEILGIAGLVGSGRTEVVSTIFGHLAADMGEVSVRGRRLPPGRIDEAIAGRIAFVPEDRKQQGLSLIGSVADNILMVVQDRMSSLGVVNDGRNAKAVDSMVRTLSIRIPSAQHRVASMSGGNQQKVVLAKWLLSEPEIVILDEPTRGIDIGAKTEIYRLMNDLAHAGKAIIMVSSELPEVIGMCDRVIVLHAGKIAGELRREDLTQERIMALASGTRQAV